MGWAYVQFLRDSSRIQVQSVPQYISAIATVHRWLAFPDLRPHDSVVEQLLKSWRLKVSPLISKKQAVPLPTSIVLQLAEEGCRRNAPQEIRAALVVVFDTAFLSRADSSFATEVGDVSVVEGPSPAILFTERRFKGKQVANLSFRRRSFRTAGIPAFASLFRRWVSTRQAAWLQSNRPESNLLWQLPDEPAPTARFLGTCFDVARRRHFHDLFGDGVRYTHHDVRRGGATAAFTVGAPLQRVCY